MGDTKIVEVKYGDKTFPLPVPILWVAASIAVVLGTLWVLPKVGVKLPWGDTVQIPQSRLVQFELAFAHGAETPAAECTLWDDAISKEVTKTYKSDRATVNLKTTAEGVTVATWITQPKALPAVIASVPVSWLASPAWAMGQCAPSPQQHGGQPEQKAEPPDQNGWYRVWLGWPDSCLGYYVYNLNGSYAADESGAPRFTWTSCVH